MQPVLLINSDKYILSYTTLSRHHLMHIHYISVSSIKFIEMLKYVMEKCLCNITMNLLTDPAL